MRVAMLGWEFPPFVSGGLGVHCYYLTRELAKLGVDIDFYTPFNVRVPWMNAIPVCSVYDLPEFRSEFGPYYVRTTGGMTTVEAGWLERFGGNFFEAVERYNGLAARLLARRHALKPYDLIHGHDWITAKSLLDAKGRTGVKTLLTMHSTEFDRTGNMGPWDWIVDVERQGVTGADRVIAVSRMLKDLLVGKFGVPEGKVDVIHNAVDASRFKERARKEKFGLGNEKIVLFHGRLSVQKGAEFFLRAAKRVLEVEPNVRFVVSGKGDLLPRLVEEAIDLGISQNVTFLGYIPEEHLPLLYGISDVYVAPSVSEPFGITVLEAMVSGTPCVVSKSCGVTEVANHCLKVDFWDVDEMANKIAALLRYSALREAISEGAREDALKATWDGVARKTLDAYWRTMR